MINKKTSKVAFGLVIAFFSLAAASQFQSVFAAEGKPIAIAEIKRDKPVDFETEILNKGGGEQRDDFAGQLLERCPTPRVEPRGHVGEFRGQQQSAIGGLARDDGVLKGHRRGFTAGRNVLHGAR